MKLAFYYHIPVFVSSDSRISLPAYFGIFLDALAQEVEELVVIAHTFRGIDEYFLNANNVRLIDLGVKTPAWHRHLFNARILKRLKFELIDVDAIIVRSPSPLAPFFVKHIPSNCLLRYYVVGSYSSTSVEMKTQFLRDWIIKLYLKYNHRLFMESLKGQDIFVNSPQLQEDLKYHCKTIQNIPTTTLTEEVFFYRDDTCKGNSVNLLYTGRLDFQKGLMELVEALALLRPMYPSVHLHFVGWDEKPNRPIEKALIRRGEELDVLDRIVFHGAMKLGDDLWNMYRLADIYCIPSYHEGFPRTIWEAMANGIPVITTPVGGIPFYLSHEENAYFVNPKSVQALAAAIKLLIEDDVLRKRIISNAFSLVKNNTVSARANQLIVHIENSINNQ